MAAKFLLILLPFGVLSYDFEVLEKRDNSDAVKVDEIILNNIVNGQFIGCKYQNLCPNDRYCYNDLLFGTCLKQNDQANFIYELATEFQNILELAMKDLFDENYKWGDFYTQCFIQSVLKSSELQQFLDVQHCKSRIAPVIPENQISGSQTRVEPSLYLAASRIRTNGDKPLSGETLSDSIRSMMKKIGNEPRSSSVYRNEEVINPKSNSEEAISVTKVNYADPSVIRKELKVAKRLPDQWIWLRFNKKISKSLESEIISLIQTSMNLKLNIEKTEWDADMLKFYIKLFPDSYVYATNITKFINNHQNILPGYIISEAGIGRQSRITAEELPIDQNFIITLTTCLVVFVGVISVLIGFLVQRFRHKKDKLGEIIKSKFHDNSTSNYKELFRGSTNKETALLKNKPVAARMNSKQHSGDIPAASSPVSTRSSTSSWTDDVQNATNMDIYTGHMILSYMEKYLKNKDIFQSEWKSIVSYDAEDAKTEAAIKIENLPKNRYQDKVPYDKSRVILKNQKSGDYINASFIVDHDPKVPLYIASQAPLEKYMADFWQMVWEQGIVIIVNLTELNETDSSQYWPKEGSQIFSIYEVNLVSEHIWSDEYLVRNFYLKNLDTAETRTVTQFHFVSWPIDKLPSSSRSILEFRRKVNKSYRSKSTPIVVHCNDGCGRTGTYILLDLILNRICKGLKEMDIAATLEHLRDQRMLLVKTEEQFGFVLTTVSEEVNNILKILNQ